MQAETNTTGKTNGSNGHAGAIPWIQTPEGRKHMSEVMTRRHASGEIARLRAKAKRKPKVKTAAKATGGATKREGRRTRLSPAQIKRLHRQILKGGTVESIAARTGLAVSTVFRHKAQLAEAPAPAEASAPAVSVPARESSGLSVTILAQFKQAKKTGYDEVRDGREFTRPELRWLLAYESMMGRSE